MNSQLFLLINILAAVLFTLWFLIGRRNKRGPVRLKMREQEAKLGKQVMETPVEDSRGDKERDVTRNLKNLKMIDPLKPLDPDEAKTLASLSYNRKIKNREELPKENRKSTKDSSSEIDNKSSESIEVRDLNVMFIYNGHDWDAYKVIGVPPGSSLVKVTESYQKLIRNMDKDALPFVEAAYRTILESSKRRKVH